MAFGYNSQGQIVWVDNDAPQGGTAMPTSYYAGQGGVIPMDPSDPRYESARHQDDNGFMALAMGNPGWGKKYDATGHVVNTSPWQKFDTAFNDAGIYGTLGMGAAAGAVAGGAALGGAYAAAPAAAPVAAAPGAAALPAGWAPVAMGSGGAWGGTGAAGTGFGALAGAPGTGGFGAVAGGTLGPASTPTLIGAGTTAVPATVVGNTGVAAAGGAHMAALAKAYGPLIAQYLGSLYANRETSAEKAQAAMIEQERQYLEYQMAKQKAQDPVHDAILRMAMGMMPTYSQNLFTNYNGLPGVNAPNPNAHYSAPGIGGGGYGGVPAPTGPSRR